MADDIKDPVIDDTTVQQNTVLAKIEDPINVLVSQDNDLAVKTALQLYMYGDFDKIKNRVDFALNCFERANDFVKAYNMFLPEEQKKTILKPVPKEIKEEETDENTEEINTSKVTKIYKNFASQNITLCGVYTIDFDDENNIIGYERISNYNDWHDSQFNHTGIDTIDDTEQPDNTDDPGASNTDENKQLYIAWCKDGDDTFKPLETLCSYHVLYSEEPNSFYIDWGDGSEPEIIETNGGENIICKHDYYGIFEIRQNDFTKIQAAFNQLISSQSEYTYGFIFDDETHNNYLDFIKNDQTPSRINKKFFKDVLGNNEDLIYASKINNFITQTWSLSSLVSNIGWFAFYVSVDNNELFIKGTTGGFTNQKVLNCKQIYPLAFAYNAFIAKNMLYTHKIIADKIHDYAFYRTEFSEYPGEDYLILKIKSYLGKRAFYLVNSRASLIIDIDDNCEINTGCFEWVDFNGNKLIINSKKLSDDMFLNFCGQNGTSATKYLFLTENIETIGKRCFAHRAPSTDVKYIPRLSVIPYVVKSTEIYNITSDKSYNSLFPPNLTIVKDNACLPVNNSRKQSLADTISTLTLGHYSLFQDSGYSAKLYFNDLDPSVFSFESDVLDINDAEFKPIIGSFSVNNDLYIKYKIHPVFKKYNIGFSDDE